MGPCFSALYFAEIILHELSHWVEDEYLKRKKIFEEDFENINTSFILIRNIAET